MIHQPKVDFQERIKKYREREREENNHFFKRECERE